MLKEIVDPKGARFELRSIPVGDPTLSALEVMRDEMEIAMFRAVQCVTIVPL